MERLFRAPAERLSVARVGRLVSARRERLGAPLAIILGAVILRVLGGVGFANYDTLYALAWGGELARLETPAYGIPIAPTPHPLLEALGVILSPLSGRAIEDVAVALGFLALSACGWVLYRLGSEWFGRGAGALAALILLTRVPILSYGVRAYVDIPYLLLVLSALLVESRNSRAGARVLVLLALAGLLRPEAWAFSVLYWLYILDWGPARARASARLHRHVPPRTEGKRSDRTRLTLIMLAGPFLWLVSDFLITGRPLWSLTNTRHTAATLGRITGIGNVPEWIPRRIGEILSAPVLLAAAVGGILALWLLPRRARLGALVGVIAVLVFGAFATAGLPIDTRYAFLPAAILAVFAGAGVFGWMRLERADQRRRWWMAGGAVMLVAILASGPSEYRSADRELGKLAHQESIKNELVALVEDGALTRRCEPVGVPNHAPIPLLALYLGTSTAEIVSAEAAPITHGSFLDPASKEVEDDYILDPHDPHTPVSVPPGFTESSANHSWFVFRHCP